MAPTGCMILEIFDCFRFSTSPSQQMKWSEVRRVNEARHVSHQLSQHRGQSRGARVRSKCGHSGDWSGTCGVRSCRSCVRVGLALGARRAARENIFYEKISDAMRFAIESSHLYSFSLSSHVWRGLSSPVRSDLSLESDVRRGSRLSVRLSGSPALALASASATESLLYTTRHETSSFVRCPMSHDRAVYQGPLRRAC